MLRLWQRSLYNRVHHDHKQAMAPVHVSLRSLMHRKLSTEEKGKAVTIDTDEEEENLRAIIIVEEEEEGMEEDIQPTHCITKFPAYIPLRKGPG